MRADLPGMLASVRVDFGLDLPSLLLSGVVLAVSVSDDAVSSAGANLTRLAVSALPEDVSDVGTKLDGSASSDGATGAGTRLACVLTVGASCDGAIVPFGTESFDVTSTDAEECERKRLGVAGDSCRAGSAGLIAGSDMGGVGVGMACLPERVVIATVACS